MRERSPHVTPGQRHRSLRDEVVDELREEIITGTLAPGQRLIERELAAQYGVSRVPLREAILQLEAEGFVRIAPRRGAMVETFSPQSVIDLFDVRESMEALAAQLAAERADQAGLDSLKARLDAARAATEAGKQEEITRANAAFHEEIVRLAENPLLESIMQPLAGRVAWLFTFMTQAAPETVCREHEALYEVIASGDGLRAAEFACAHVAATREPTLAALEALIATGHEPPPAGDEAHTDASRGVGAAAARSSRHRLPGVAEATDTPQPTT